MKTTIDKAGRVVIPAAIRARAGFCPGTTLQVVLEDASVRLVRQVRGPELVKVGKRLVARPTASPGERPVVDLAALVEEERHCVPR